MDGFGRVIQLLDHVTQAVGHLSDRGDWLSDHVTQLVGHVTGHVSYHHQGLHHQSYWEVSAKVQSQQFVRVQLKLLYWTHSRLRGVT